MLSEEKPETLQMLPHCLRFSWQAPTRGAALAGCPGVLCPCVRFLSSCAPCADSNALAKNAPFSLCSAWENVKTDLCYHL